MKRQTDRQGGREMETDRDRETETETETERQGDRDRQTESDHLFWHCNPKESSVRLHLVAHNPLMTGQRQRPTELLAMEPTTLDTLVDTVYMVLPS